MLLLGGLFVSILLAVDPPYTGSGRRVTGGILVEIYAQIRHVGSLIFFCHTLISPEAVQVFNTIHKTFVLDWAWEIRNSNFRIICNILMV
jgi:hypothetical protein